MISKNCGFDERDTVEIACERFNNDIVVEFCDMTEKTIINSTNFIIADLRDEDIEGIRFDGNKRVEYLPYKTYMQLPNLVYFTASGCSLKQIIRENFEKLSRLKFLDFSFNQIQKISGNTFSGLTDIDSVELSEITNF